jgi:hypothetical protein
MRSSSARNSRLLSGSPARRRRLRFNSEAIHHTWRAAKQAPNNTRLMVGVSRAVSIGGLFLGWPEGLNHREIYSNYAERSQGQLPLETIEAAGLMDFELAVTFLQDKRSGLGRGFLGMNLIP